MPREFYRQHDGLIEAGLARMEMRVVFDHDQERLVLLVDAEYFDGKFSGPEREAVDRTLETLKDMTATEASDYSHGEVSFLIAADGETIPYEAAYFVSKNDHELNRVIDRAFAAWVRNRDGELRFGVVINVRPGVEAAIRDGLDAYLDDTQQLGSEWCERVFHDGALEAKVAAWARVSLTLRSNRTGEEVVWIATLRKRQEPENAHQDLYEFVGFFRLDADG